MTNSILEKRDSNLGWTAATFAAVGTIAMFFTVFSFLEFLTGADATLKPFFICGGTTLLCFLSLWLVVKIMRQRKHLSL